MLFLGFGLVSFAGVCGGALGLPLRMRRRYGLEHMWIVSYGLATVVLPLVLACLWLPHWPQALAQAGTGNLSLSAAMGVGWGIAIVAYGYGVSAAGLSLGGAIIMGLATAAGSVIPLLRRWEAIPLPARALTAGGIALCVLGVALYGRAGMLRERAAGGGTSGGARTGILFCVVSGLLSACANLGFDWAEPLAGATARLGAQPWLASSARWLPVYAGGFSLVLLYSAFRLTRRRAWASFAGPGAGRDLGLAAGMGILHFLGQVPYGWGAYWLGALGTSAGWAICVGIQLLVANLLGVAMHEWKPAPRAAWRLFYAGLAALLAAMALLAAGNAWA